MGITAAGGLGIVVAGGAPADSLHYVYAVLAFALVPVADSLVARARPRTRGVTTLIAAVVALVVLIRLFQTG